MSYSQHPPRHQGTDSRSTVTPRTASLRTFVIIMVVMSCAFAAPVIAQETTPCGHVTVLSQQSGSAIFFGGFESGSVDPWGTASVFRATEVLDLEFVVSFDATINSEHLLELELQTPNGHLYQVLSAPISGDQTRAGGSMNVPGYPRPLPIITPRTHADAKTAQMAYRLSLPVAGSSISRAALYGLWQVSGRLDVHSMSCDGPEVFVIVE